MNKDGMLVLLERARFFLRDGRQEFAQFYEDFRLGKVVVRSIADHESVLGKDDMAALLNEFDQYRDNN
jgi:hypothetical protein